jgi:hypothetical protein
VWWGVGHTLTLFMVGGVIILFSVVIPPRLGLSMELSVAVMLILLGIMNLAGFRGYMKLGTATPPAAMPTQVHAHPHQHGDYVHTHTHGHAPEAHPHQPDATPLGWLDRHLGKARAYQAIRPLVVGIVHGLAGSAAVALMILATITNRSWAMFYLLVFGVGTILGMMLLTGAIAVPFAFTRTRHASLHRRLGLASGVLSLVFGVLLAYQLGFVNGLFTAHPTWTPR